RVFRRYGAIKHHPSQKRALLHKTKTFRKKNNRMNLLQIRHQILLFLSVDLVFSRFPAYRRLQAHQLGSFRIPERAHQIHSIGPTPDHSGPLNSPEGLEMDQKINSFQ
ncbi:MAG: hypothetical protein VCE91_16575, partial [Nitrospinota bacterium]